tara:strand:- start:1186 stop:1743 length:558 start_codon:yes stop_codon:yes gene_type:complete
MSTLFVNNLNTASGSTITVPTGKVLTAPGHIIQVDQTVKTDTLTENSQSAFVDIGLAVSIAPKFATSKILVQYRVATSIVNGAYGCYLRLVRGSTDIALGDARGNRLRASTIGLSNTGAGGYNVFYQTLDFLDEPSTTNNTTYKIQARGWNTSAGNFHINRNDVDTNSIDHATGVSTITVMEVAQ